MAAGTPVALRSPLCWIPHWLQPGWSRLLGHRPRPAVKGRPVVLRDGSKVVIRQVQATDAPLLADGFARLSPQSRRMRFLARKDQLSAAELRYFTELDHHDHEALGAVSQADGRGVGVARYVRDAHHPQAAEIAVTVVDEWQGRGLGTELLTRLSGRARSEGIHRFTALVAEDNMAMAGLLQNMNASLAGRSPGTVEYEITLIPQATARPHQPRACARTVPGRRAELPGPVANQESQSRGVVIEIQQRLLAGRVPRAYPGQPVRGEASPGTRASSARDQGVRPRRRRA
jgi:RimJ/RimL family protein N-acetyltransferase